MFVPSISPRPTSSVAGIPRPGDTPRFAALCAAFPQDLELQSLTKESDRALFEAGWLRWAMGREMGGDLHPAAQAYAALTSSESDAIARQAQRRLELLSGGGSLGDRVETKLRHFTREALHPAGILGMTVASLAFRWTRVATLRSLLQTPAVGPLGRGLGARFAASLTGFAVEAPALLFAGKGVQQLLGEKPAWDRATLRQEWLGTALFLGGMKLGGLLAHSAMRLPAGLGSSLPRSGPWLGQGATLGGALLGKGLELHFLNPGHSEAWFLEGLAAYLQGRAGAGVGAALLGPRWRGLEIALDLQAAKLGEISSPRPKAWLRQMEGLAWAGQALQEKLPESAIFPNHLMSSLGDGGGRNSKTESLLARFRPRFPRSGSKVYSEEILQTALETPIFRETWRERLLQAYSEARDVGSYEQLLIAEGVKKIFSYDGLRTGIGSFDLSVLQFGLERALAAENPAQRRQSLRLLFFLMERDLSRASLTRALQTMGLSPELAAPHEPVYHAAFERRWVPAIGRYWSGYRASDVPLLLNFVYEQAASDPAKAEGMIRILGRGPKRYPEADRRTALDYAARSRLGRLALRRFFLILAAEDIPAKLRELQVQETSEPTVQKIQELETQGLDKDEIIQKIKGTRHNAYLDDPRLTKKILSVLHAKSEASQDSAARRLEARLGLQQGIRRALKSGDPLSPETLLELLQWNPDLQTRRLLRHHREGRFDLRIASDAEFEALFQAWGMAQRCDGALFIKAFGGMKRDLILVRELSPAARAAGGSSHAAYEELMLRLEAVVHEWEHFRHFNGEIAIRGLSREERLVSEIMASLEEDRWQSYFSPSDTPLGRLAHRLGQPLPLYLRDFHDWLYFSRRNAERTAGWLRD